MAVRRLEELRKATDSSTGSCSMILLLRHAIVAGLIFSLHFYSIPAQAAIVEYDLVIAQQEVNITGKTVWAMTINGDIPGPTLRFKEGDIARIHVHNRMSVDTSIHWHGVLVPNEMDGVPYVTFPPIRPGAAFTYEFPIRQSGTYWYHSHTSLQEQGGIYGSIVIEPFQANFRLDRDYVVLFSDWTNEDPNEVIRTLKRGSEWYAIEKGAGQSILGAARLGMLGSYFRRELQRMPAMDISDVAYDYFLANGRPELVLAAEPGETVRLRIIDGSATTYFHLEFAGGSMTIVAADGLDVEPVEERRFLISVAETYDVLLKVPGQGAYEFRASAHDGSSHASVWIGSGERHCAPDVPRPNLYHAMGDLSLKQLFALTPAGAMGMPDQDVEAGKFDQLGMMSMGNMHMNGMQDMDGMNRSDDSRMKMKGMDHDTSSMEGMNHGGQTTARVLQYPETGKKCGTDFRILSADVSASENLAIDGMDPGRPWPPYDKLRSLKKTAFSIDKPVREIRLTLDGDMERYVWFLNNKPLSESDSILIRKGEIARFIMINRTMMHHPMHLHGHFFRVINAQGDYAPLKHTVNVAPMSTTVIEFDANESGDWFFHCHLLYHMKSGMAGVVHYEGFTLNPALAAGRPQLYKDSWYFWGREDVLSNMIQGSLTLSNTRNILTAEWEVGWQKVDETRWEGLFTWDRYVNRFFSVFAGANFLGEGNESEDIRALLGIRYLLPLNFESRIWVDSDIGARFTLEKIFELTPRLWLFGEAEYDTHDFWEERIAVSYQVYKNLFIIGQWHSDFGFGGGIRFLF
jgi:CopA family copper-resistance protein